jgi:hypothetical protein
VATNFQRPNDGRPPNSSQPCGGEFRSSSKRANGAKLRISDPKEGIRNCPKGQRYGSRCVGGRDDRPGDSRATFIAIFQVQSVSRAQAKAELRRARRRKPKVQRWNFHKICRISHDDDGQLKMAPSQGHRFGEALCIGASRSENGPFILPMELDIMYELSSSAELAKAAQGIPWSSIQFVRGGSQWQKDTGNVENP